MLDQDKGEMSQELKQVLINKQKSDLQMHAELTDAKLTRGSEIAANSILDMAEAWLSEPGAQFVLGAGAEYSLGDLMMTTFLTRLSMHPEWFAENVSTRPAIVKYWNYVRTRPSYTDGRQNAIAIPSACKANFILTLLQAVVSAFLAGLAYLIVYLCGGYEKDVANWRFNYWMLWLYSFSFVFLLFNTVIMCLGCKARAAMQAHARRLGWKREAKSELQEGGALDDYHRGTEMD